VTLSASRLPTSPAPSPLETEEEEFGTQRGVPPDSRDVSAVRPIAVVERSYERDEERECHPILQVVLPKRGRLEMVVGDVRCAADGGTYAVVAPGADHAFRAPLPNRFLVVDLAPGPELESARKPFRPIDPRIDALARLLSVEARMGSFGDPLVADALARYTRTLLEDRTVPRAKEPTTVAPLTERIRDVVESRLAEPLTLAEIAVAAASDRSMRRGSSAEPSG
jgi:hypothetical protein